MVGRLHPQKGHHFLIQAVPEIVRSFGEVAVVFAGGGELERVLKEEVASLGLSRQVTFLGHVDRPGLLVGALDVAVMPSLYEGFSLSMLEFMAAGVPCVFSDHASFVEATDGGQDRRARRTAECRREPAAICGILSNHAEARRMADEACRTVLERFSVDAHIRELMSLHDRLLDQRGERG